LSFFLNRYLILLGAVKGLINVSLELK
jgi:hypothetical protein